MGGSTQDQLYDAFGTYVRSQRHLAKLTLRQVADLARISNPYLSQIEHGLVLPSIAVLSALADALSVSAETMLLRAAGVVRPNTTERLVETEHAIRHDPRLDTGQKHALLAVLGSFVAASAVEVPPLADSGTDRTGLSDAVADEAPSDRTPFGDSRTEPARKIDAQKIAAGQDDAGQDDAAVRRGSLTSMSARPAAAGRVADPRRQGV